MSFPIYFDEDAQDAELIRVLRLRGLTVTCANEHGMRHKKDPEQLEFAASKNWVVFTHNTGDFCRLHSDWMKKGRNHSGIIVSFQQYHHLGERAARTTHIDAMLSSEEMRNRLEYLSNW